MDYTICVRREKGHCCIREACQALVYLIFTSKLYIVYKPILSCRNPRKYQNDKIFGYDIGLKVAFVFKCMSSNEELSEAVNFVHFWFFV